MIQKRPEYLDYKLLTDHQTRFTVPKGAVIEAERLLKLADPDSKKIKGKSYWNDGVASGFASHGLDILSLYRFGEIEYNFAKDALVLDITENLGRFYPSKYDKRILGTIKGKASEMLSKYIH